MKALSCPGALLLPLVLLLSCERPDSSARVQRVVPTLVASCACSAGQQYCAACGSQPARCAAECPACTPCASDSDCDDGVYCTGTEKCEPGSSLADSRGCTRAVACAPSDVCDETAKSCRSNGRTQCGESWTNLLIDANNCGACGKACASGRCSSGVCAAAVQWIKEVPRDPDRADYARAAVVTELEADKNGNAYLLVWDEASVTLHQAKKYVGYKLRLLRYDMDGQHREERKLFTTGVKGCCGVIKPSSDFEYIPDFTPFDWRLAAGPEGWTLLTAHYHLDHEPPLSRCGVYRLAASGTQRSEWGAPLPSPANFGWETHCKFDEIAAFDKVGERWAALLVAPSSDARYLLAPSGRYKLPSSDGQALATVGTNRLLYYQSGSVLYALNDAAAVQWQLALPAAQTVSLVGQAGGALLIASGATATRWSVGAQTLPEPSTGYIAAVSETGIVTGLRAAPWSAGSVVVAGELLCFGGALRGPMQFDAVRVQPEGLSDALVACYRASDLSLVLVQTFGGRGEDSVSNLAAGPDDTLWVQLKLAGPIALSDGPKNKHWSGTALAKLKLAQ